LNFFDLNLFEEEIEADICIVGSGPAGLTIAGELIETGKSIWVIESGINGIDSKTQKLYQYENIGANRVASQDLIRIRSYGGTSSLWSGRVAVFSDIDFSKREWVDFSGWPIDRNDLEPYFERANEILGLGPNIYDGSLFDILKVKRTDLELNLDSLCSEFWQFSKSKSVKGEPTRFAKDFNPKDSDNLNILLNANLTNINTNSTASKIKSITVKSLDGKTKTIAAKTVVLCCGGIENARVLLASKSQSEKGVGNQNDMVGRFFMDHPYCELGEFDVQKSKKLIDRFGHYWLDDENGRHVFLHGLALSKEIQKKEKLLNCSAYLVGDDDIDESWLIAKRFLMDIKALKFKASTLKDLISLLLNTNKIIDGFFRRYYKKRPPILQSKRIAIGCNVEQQPDPDSRITLSDQKDLLGMPLARIDWKISEKERKSVIRMMDVISEEFSNLGLPVLQKAEWIYKKDWKDNFYDVAHHIGSTRMSNEPEKGVVDKNCKVYGVEGLYIAGSSIFPTAGTANPTLMIVLMSLRLANHIKMNNI
jgi:choline dehydrogenase-like flavoprotein